ncbi:IclR family transcriptional regulator [Thermoflavimicrobium dichotomicum]|uniref:DNA-binding transcriptional regulator, IclR family n=1 Tax=Thermoflavimicrobium dichotomicum TaxID=46223 RepID=A0A1I3Q9M8_9BACL|nr:IclR family transcriptional regulator [Thermoflavimicrobium dichotomicum]SFJ30390.1 DNA-binding transcriptional regulator, IclR family [Thermoflavimicrobium dichotomicum]
MKKSKTTIKSVSKALQILELLGKHPNGLMIKEISILLKLNLSTTYHLINTMLEHGYVNKTKDDVYLLGYQIPFLNNAFLQSMAPDTMLNHCLEELSEITLETAYLGKERDGEVIIHNIIEGPQAIKVKALYIGYRDYPHARALPKAIIAFWSDSKIENYFKGKKFEKLTESTPSNLDELMKELYEIRKLGYSIDEQAFTKGICCIAAPVFDASKKPVAAYSVSVPYDRYNNNRDEYVEKVCMIAKKASRYLGCSE